jgi:hypothetical protein
MGRKQLGLRLLGWMALAASVVACSGMQRPTPIAKYPSLPLSAPAATAATTADEDLGEDEPEDAADEPEDEAATAEPAEASPCPDGMALVTSASADKRFCVDRYEAALVEVQPDGTERPFPHYLPVDGHDVRAVSEAGVFPQGFISEVQAQDACAASGKRLCSHDEWKTACRGPANTTFPYGEGRRPGVCHDTGKSAVAAVFGAAALASGPVPTTTGKASRASGKSRRGSHSSHVSKAHVASKTNKSTKASKASKVSKASKASTSKTHRASPARASSRPASVEASVWTKLNDPALGQVDGALARTGDHGACVNEWGVYDMVGNLHEWVAGDPSSSHGTFAGGYYLDTSQNGDGCEYRTVAHAHDYHDYSTGFRCCADLPATASK